MDAMVRRQGGEQGWQLNLREQLPAQTPKHLLDLREPAEVKNQRFFEYMKMDALPLRAEPVPIAEEPWYDELDIDEKLAGWWQWAKATARMWPAAALAAAAVWWTRIRANLSWPGRRALGVFFAVALLAGLGVLVAASQSTQRIAGQGVSNPPGRGGVPLLGALPTTGAGNWLDILISHFQNGKYQKLSPAAYAQPSPGFSSSVLSTGLVPISSTSSSGSGTTTQPVSQPVTQPAPAPVPQPSPLPLSTPAPTTAPLPVPSVPLQPITQPLQPITQPLSDPTAPLSL